jgi:hypothetical protein
VQTTARDRTIDEWKLRASHPDNHWLDCLVGAAVAASIQGVSLRSHQRDQRRQERVIKLSELQRKKR